MTPRFSPYSGWSPDDDYDPRVTLSRDNPCRPVALAHCLTCAESWHGGWVDGPCDWPGCELRTETVDDLSGQLANRADAAPLRSLHSTGDTRG